MTHIELPSKLSRREFLARSGAAAGALWAGATAEAAGNSGRGSRKPKVAAVFTEFRFRSHAYNILENFFEPYLFGGELTDPGVEVVSFYADQFPENDMARKVSRRLDVPLFDTIEEALCLGGKEQAVDAVLSIGEHGDYPVNELGQKMYPRKRFFDEIAAVMRRSGRSGPVFNDKHLFYSWDEAQAMYETARELHIPLMAGSSVPLAQRMPPLELPQDAEIAEAVSIHGGGLESYGFHALEVLQSFVESRKGGETSIEQIQVLSGEALEAALKKGRISSALVHAAMEAEREMGVRRQKYPALDKVQEQAPVVLEPEQPPRDLQPQHAIVVIYRDGLQATVLKVGSDANRWNFACRLQGEDQPRATALFNGPWGNRCLFKALSHAIQYLFVHDQPPYPVERTLLVTGALEAAVQSHHRDGEPVNTPHLEFAYSPIDFRRFRETGASWEIITPETPQPVAFRPGDAQFVDRP